MARPKKSDRIFSKSESALVAAIEAYNRPTSHYREENFCILALNAWELLIKAKLLAQHSEDLRCLYLRERVKKKSGGYSKKFGWKKGRSGNKYTHGLNKAIVELEKTPGIRLDNAVKKNLEAVTEVRDTSVHYINAGPEFAQRVHEIGTACITNFVKLAQGWFNQDLSKYNLYLMPIGFVPVSGVATGIVIGLEERNLVDYIVNLAHNTEINSGDFSVSLEIDVSLKRAGSTAEGAFALTNDPSDPSATKLYLTDEEILKDFPWNYKDLCDHLAGRYSDFSRNQKFFAIKKPLIDDAKYVHIRYLDPKNPKSSQKGFYKPTIINEFDKHYTRT